MDVLYKKCQGKFFTRNQIDERGIFAMDPDDALPLAPEEGKLFFVCPHCEARNIVISAPDVEGVSQLRISHAED